MLPALLFRALLPFSIATRGNLRPVFISKHLKLFCGGGSEEHFAPDKRVIEKTEGTMTEEYEQGLK
jgi:hypothetical protein